MFVANLFKPRRQLAVHRPCKPQRYLKLKALAEVTTVPSRHRSKKILTS